MYSVVTYTYLEQAETWTFQSSKQLIFQLNYFKENRTDINLIIIYEFDKTTKRLEERLVLEMDK